ncbi:MAG: hypothetical protein JNK42_02155 [Caedimonas sp.]|nr:hypothetical protein [Caedimonas sp.]
MNNYFSSFSIAYLGLTISLLFSSSQIWSSDIFKEGDSVSRSTMSAEQLKELEEISKYIDEIEAKIPLKQEEAILIIGDSGEGKSTLLNYLADIPLNGKRNKGSAKLIIDTDKPLNGAELSHGIRSKTSLPSGCQKYWDCPGFLDTRGPVQNIVNAFSIYKLAKGTENLKVLVTVSENTIEGSRASTFLKLISNLGKTFKNTDELTKGLCLVVTKNRELTPDLVKEKLDSILEDEDSENTLNPSQKAIIKYLASSQDEISFFNAPKKEGIISADDKHLILEAIQKIAYLKKPEPSISIPPESQIFITDLVERLNNDILQFISSKFCPEILSYSDTLIREHSGTAKGLRASFKNLSDQLKGISRDSGEFENNLQKILAIITGTLEQKELEKQFSKKISRFEFLKLVKPESLEIKGNTDSWYSDISDSIQDMDVLASAPEKDEQRNFLTLKGLIIGIEDLDEKDIQEKELSEVNVYSLNSLFVDKDIAMPGINLTLISPEWHIVDRRIINLKGKPGDAHQQEKADDGVVSQHPNGKDGLPGLPGYSGGRLYGKGKEFFDLSHLTVDVSGGNGGQGQSGGDGAKGRDGEEGNLVDVQERKEENLFSRKKIKAEKVKDYVEKGVKFFLTFNDKFKEVYKSGTSGEKGGNAGQGGIGGLGGKSGSVFIDSQLPENENPDITQKDGPRGSNGQAGTPGVGGKHGRQYRGVYINEMVAPAVRGYKELDKESGSESTEIIREIGVNTVKGSGLSAVAGGAIAKATTKEVVTNTFSNLKFCKIIIENGVTKLVSEGGQELAKEGTKLVMQETSKNTFKLFTKEAAEQIAQEGGKVIVQDVLKLGIESGKQTISVGVISTGVSMLTGVAGSLAAQAALSPISAWASSGWEEEAAEINDGTEYASGGEDKADLFNEENIQDPPASNPPINQQEKQNSYDQFYIQRKDLPHYNKFVRDIK